MFVAKAPPGASNLCLPLQGLFGAELNLVLKLVVLMLLGQQLTAKLAQLSLELCGLPLFLCNGSLPKIEEQSGGALSKLVTSQHVTGSYDAVGSRLVRQAA